MLPLSNARLLISDQKAPGHLEKKRHYYLLDTIL
jgi:hypothetical protein